MILIKMSEKKAKKSKPADVDQDMEEDDDNKQLEAAKDATKKEQEVVRHVK